jgi:hypothetical protein
MVEILPHHLFAGEGRMVMKDEKWFQGNRHATQGMSPQGMSRVALLAGVAAGLAALALLLTARGRQQSRRYADRHDERRNSMHFFLAGQNPQRRDIDRSGKRPLFERRQSVYDAY